MGVVMDAMVKATRHHLNRSRRRSRIVGEKGSTLENLVQTFLEIHEAFEVHGIAKVRAYLYLKVNHGLWIWLVLIAHRPRSPRSICRDFVGDFRSHWHTDPLLVHGDSDT